MHRLPTLLDSVRVIPSGTTRSTSERQREDRSRLMLERNCTRVKTEKKGSAYLGTA